MQKLTVIVGPTASGKTEAGLRLARENQGVVVSADSRQVYAGMNIGTATPLKKNTEHKTQNPNKAQDTKHKEHNPTVNLAPHAIMTPDIFDEVEHYLLNIRRPDEPLTLAEWQAAAFLVIDEMFAKGIVPLLVGGTMLYVDSVVLNYDIPHVAKNESLRYELEKFPVEVLYQQLLTADPAAAEFVQPRNKRRIVRALEVIKTTGDLFSTHRRIRPPRYKPNIIGIFPGWEVLKERIESRAKQMLAEGLLEETQLLREAYGSDLPLLQTINYKQAGSVLDSKMTLTEATEEMIKANMRYARRQMSWWKKRKEIKWYQSPQDLLSASSGSANWE